MDLPSLPVARQRAFTVLANPEVPLREVGSIVEADPGLTAALLRAANSAAYAPLKRIGTANGAIVRIGLAMTRRILASAALGQSFAAVQHAGIAVDDLWAHAVATALLADASAWADGPHTEAFTAGLLHPIGRLAMAVEDPSLYQRVVRRVHAGEAPLEAEEAVFGRDSAQWGTEVARAWDFPDHIVDAIADCYSGEGSPLGRVVWNARRITWSLGYGDGLQRPREVTFDPDSEDGSILANLGGPNALDAQIRWYSGAMTDAA